MERKNRMRVWNTTPSNNDCEICQKVVNLHRNTSDTSTSPDDLESPYQCIGNETNVRIHPCNAPDLPFHDKSNNRNPLPKRSLPTVRHPMSRYNDYQRTKKQRYQPNHSDLRRCWHYLWISPRDIYSFPHSSSSKEGMLSTRTGADGRAGEKVNNELSRLCHRKNSIPLDSAKHATSLHISVVF